MYTITAAKKVTATLLDLFSTGFNSLEYLTQHDVSNLTSLVFIKYSWQYDSDFHVRLHQTLASFYQDTGISLFCFASKLFSDEIPYMEAVPHTFIHLEAIIQLPIRDQFFFSEAKLLATTFLQRNAPSLFEDFTNFSYLSNQQISLIEVLLSNNINVSAAASLLYSHRNTISYQLQKIISITGFDIRNADDQLLFHLFIFVHRAHSNAGSSLLY
ncbi:MAG: helix-turn-helix domain-containing protein [Culicoidibacterales bacterium]